MRRVAAGAIAVGLAAAVGVVGALAARRAPAAELTPADIVARSAAARGGLEAWRKVETMVWLGHVESAHAPEPNMTFELEQKRPNKTRLALQALAGGKSMRVFDGVRGWKVHAGGGRPEVQPYTPHELIFARAGHGIDGPLLDHAARGDPATLEGVDDLGGRKAYHLGMRLANGAKEEVWVDAETWLEVRYDRMVEGPGSPARPVSVRYGDYRSVEGLKIPFLIETGSGPGTTPDRMRIERVVLNAPLDDGMFANPAGPRPRHAARAGGTPLVTTPAAAAAAPAPEATARGAAPP
jgi:hypothetical protein